MLYGRLVYLYLFCMLLFLVTMVSGCIVDDVTRFESVDLLVCQEPLVEIDGECCLDRNLNEVCDFKEDKTVQPADKRDLAVMREPVLSNEIPSEYIEQQTSQKPECVDQCKADFCRKDVYYECFLEVCMVERKVGVVAGKCGVECLSDKDCDPGEFCNSTRCESLDLEFCGDGVCSNDEDCGNCVTDCICQEGTFCRLGTCAEKKEVPFFDFYCVLGNSQFCIGTVDFNDLEFAEYEIVTRNIGEYGIICNYKEHITLGNKTDSWRREVRAGQQVSNKIRISLIGSGEFLAQYEVECFIEGQEQFAVTSQLSFNATWH